MKRKRFSKSSNVLDFFYTYPLISRDVYFLTRTHIGPCGLRNRQEIALCVPVVYRPFSSTFVQTTTFSPHTSLCSAAFSAPSLCFSPSVCSFSVATPRQRNPSATMALFGDVKVAKVRLRPPLCSSTPTQWTTSLRAHVTYAPASFLLPFVA